MLPSRLAQRWLPPGALSALAVAGLLVAGAPVAEAQVRDPIEPAGMDFRRDGAWRRRTAEIRTERAGMLRSGDIAGLNRGSGVVFRGPFAIQAIGAPGPAVTGRYVLPVIPIGYSDVSAPYAPAELAEVLFGATPPFGRPYTLKTYYEELSRGRIEMQGVVFPAFAHTQNAAWVTDGCNGLTIPGRTTCARTGSQNHMGQMLVAALEAVSVGPGEDTVWNAFDNDGPDGLPNSGDDDGYVDFVTFLHPEVGGECSGNSGIWAHRWRMAVWNNGSAYVTRTPRRNAQGQPIAGQFLLVDDYTIQSQRGGSTGCSSGAIMPVGTVAHETGHAFGLPDLYDTSNQTNGIGDWSLMSFGNQVTQQSPSSYDAWSLVTLGWATVDELTTDRVVTTGARATSDTVFLARTPRTSQQYLLIENRQAVGSDTAQMGPGVLTRRKAPGLLLWYVDEQKITINTLSNTVNAGATHGVALLQADGLNQLRSRANRGDIGDAYPGTSGNTRFGLTTNPVARTYEGFGLGFGIDNIAQLAGTTMTFRFTRNAPTVVAASHPDVLVRVNLIPYQRYEEVVARGESLALAVDQQLNLLGGRSRATFLGWSDGGAREHTIVTSTTKADTVVASFALEHRLIALTDGAGTVTADRPGNLLAGIFLPQGLATTLTATPAPGGGVFFTGWTGDTVSASPTLRLPMERPYDVTALFTTTVAVPRETARAAILGTATLSAEQRQQLDALGNQNGYFDVGDYLSLLQRVGAVGGAPAGEGGAQ